jgi:hypothetical protein
MVGAKLRDLDSAMAVKDSKDENLLADAFEQKSIFHIFAPSCIGEVIPCISQVTTLSLPC